MYPYENNDQNRNDQGGWDGQSYHYSYTPPAQPQQSQGAPGGGKKKRGAARIVALVLCCALVGGGAGVGGAAIYSSVNGASGTQAPSGGGETTIYQNKTDPTPVKVSQADGLTPMSLSEIYASYVDSCVCVTVQTVVQQGYYQYEASGAGSGFIISEDGYIVTNYHVIDGARAIKVTFNNGETYDAKLVGGEELNDVAVLKVDGVKNLKPVVLGDSDDLVVGETVCTIGNALGSLSFSQTSGGVSATDRAVTMSDGTVINMIQTDCTINSGNSGGPLFNSHGEVIGIVSAKYSSGSNSSSASVEGLGFAIPMDDVASMVSDLVKNGYVTGKPIMGISVADVDESVTSYGVPQGAIIRVVTPDLCGAKAGLQAGDIVTKIDNTDVTSASDLTSAIGNYKPGDKVTLTIFRSGETKTVEVTLEESTPEKTEKQNQAQQEYQQEYQQSQQQQQQSQQQQQGSSGWPFGSFGY